MATRQRRKSVLAPLALPLVAVLFSAYFAWHAWHGSFGVEARRQFDVEADRLRAQLVELDQEKATIERRVQLLRPQGLESDMLDERAREILGFAHPNDVAIYPHARISALAPSRQSNGK
ncbi:MAG: septum formation initiator family protein [Ancalomicrobiaceae bacterium]|nr:septum formation initiator family protein [Ancalomicrobiaceae bacterium]